MGAQESASSAKDVTQEHRDLEGIVAAINRVQAVIEFDLDGTILTANENFTATVGYDLNEIKGQHHRIFCDPEYANSDAYRDFWLRLAMGEPVAGEFRRIGKGGGEIWINASYNPIFNAEGKPFKVVKFATDITERKHAEYINLLKSTGFENSSRAMMTVNRDFVVTEVNGATRELMTKNKAVFAEAWPDFDPSKIVGTCIDQFHKNPAHQRELLSDPKNLPFHTDITIGDFKFALNVGGIFDENKNYVGNILE